MKNNCPTNNKSAKGFTLIELLIVIAVLGVLAAVVLVAINPLEQLARGRDSGRKTTVGQLKNASMAYYTSHAATFASHTGGWASNLTVSGDLKAIPASVSYSKEAKCVIGTLPADWNGAEQNGWCYFTNYLSEAVVYARLESTSDKSKCGAQNVYFLWSSTDGQAGVVCSAADPVLISGYVYK